MTTNHEKQHLRKVKELPCGLCGASPPSDAHHILEGNRRIGHYATIPLCHSQCHQGDNGRHGDGTIFRIMKKTELQILADTIRKLTGG